MGYYETFDHTADLGLRIRAVDLNDLFETSARALFDTVLANRDEIQVQNQERIELTASNLPELVAEWLGELLFRCETTHRVYRDFDVTVHEADRRLTATIGGEPIDRERHILDHEVKAITRHGLIVERDGSSWFAELIVDI